MTTCQDCGIYNICSRVKGMAIYRGTNVSKTCPSYIPLKDMKALRGRCQNCTHWTRKHPRAKMGTCPFSCFEVSYTHFCKHFEGKKEATKDGNL